MDALKNLSDFNCAIKSRAHFFYEMVIKEFSACLKHLWYRCRYAFDSTAHDFNPDRIEKASHPDQIAKVILLLHGVGAHKSCFIPLASVLTKGGVANIYTVDLHQTSKQPVPTQSLKSTLNRLDKRYRNAGYAGVQFGLIGHSLGALSSAKYVWREWNAERDFKKIIFVISLAGRLKYIASPFSWFCEDVRPEIEKTYQALLACPHKAHLYSLWGEHDALVPKNSSHLFGDARRELTIKGCGHGGIVFSPHAHQKILKKVRAWIFNHA